MADISKIKLPGDNTEYNIKDTTARAQSGVTGVKGNAESSYRTGNVNVTAANVGAIPTNTTGNTQNLSRPSAMRGLNDVTLDAKINTLRANRLAFLPADQIIIEQTVDGGSTWTDAGVSDAVKAGLFSETRVGVGLPRLNGVQDKRCGLRITITAMKYNVPSGTTETQKYNYWNSSYIKSQERYCQLKEFYFWVNTINNSIGIKIERATGAAPNNWAETFNDSAYYMTGWDGCDYVKLNWQATFGGGTTQTSNYWNYRLTFMTKGQNGTDTMGTGYETSQQSVSEIRAYGDTWWGRPNEYMANDKIYTHDYLQNVTFPKAVTATGGFSGALTGNVTGTASGNLPLAGGTMSGNAIVTFPQPQSGDTGLRFTDGSNPKLYVGMGSGRVNRGMYDDEKGDWIVYSNGSNAFLNGTATVATKADMFTGFSSHSTSGSWGNQTGTVVTRMDSPAGGSIIFRDNNPINGQLSMLIDGTIYVREGVYQVFDKSETIPVANGGTGKTTGVDAANYLINSLTTGSSDPTDNDYYVSQYAGGGTTTTTFHRRPVSALWNYIRGKISSVLGLTATNYGGTSAKATADASGNTISSYYAPKSTAVTNIAHDTTNHKITKTINGTTTDVVTAATTSAYGITTLSSSTSSTSTTVAATPSAVKTAYDLANTANGTANTALSGVNGSLIYDHTFTISNGVATFTPHVYCKGSEVTTNYAKSCFTWKYRLIDGSEVTLTTKNDRGCDVTITNLGYGGHVIGIFVPA